MATNSNHQEFYREVDRYRHQRGCWSVGFIVLLILVAGAVVYLYLHRHGFL